MNVATCNRRVLKWCCSLHNARIGSPKFLNITINQIAYRPNSTALIHHLSLITQFINSRVIKMHKQHMIQAMWMTKTRGVVWQRDSKFAPHFLIQIQYYLHCKQRHAQHLSQLILLKHSLTIHYHISYHSTTKHEKLTLPLNFFSSSLTSLTWIFLKALRRRYGTWITTAFLFPATSIWLQSHDRHHHQRYIHATQATTSQQALLYMKKRGAYIALLM